MFIERLTDVQLTAFAKELTRPITKFKSRDWSIYIRKQKDFARVSLSVKDNSQYDISFNLFNFEVSIFNSGMLLETFISKKFIQFMYRIFGEEYKTAYLANAAKIFDEE